MPLCFTQTDVDKWFGFVEYTYPSFFNYQFEDNNSSSDKGILCLCASLLTIIIAKSSDMFKGGFDKLPVSESAGDLSVSYAQIASNLSITEVMIYSNFHGLQFENEAKKLITYEVF